MNREKIDEPQLKQNNGPKIPKITSEIVKEKDEKEGEWPQQEKMDEKEDINEYKIIKKDSELSWEGKNYENPKTYEFPLRIHQGENVEKCDQCLMLFETTELFKTYLRDEKDKLTIRIIETEQE